MPMCENMYVCFSLTGHRFVCSSSIICLCAFLSFPAKWMVCRLTSADMGSWNIWWIQCLHVQHLKNDCECYGEHVDVLRPAHISFTESCERAYYREKRDEKRTTDKWRICWWLNPPTWEAREGWGKEMVRGGACENTLLCNERRHQKENGFCTRYESEWKLGGQRG